MIYNSTNISFYLMFQESGIWCVTRHDAKGKNDILSGLLFIKTIIISGNNYDFYKLEEKTFFKNSKAFQTQKKVYLKKCVKNDGERGSTLSWIFI